MVVIVVPYALLYLELEGFGPSTYDVQYIYSDELRKVLTEFLEYLVFGFAVHNYFTSAMYMHIFQIDDDRVQSRQAQRSE